MIEFINFLKLIATVLITNSHFGDIWPVSAMASGGLLGNVIFLAVSGFLLFNLKENFPKWFLKRFSRIYPAMAVFTLFAVAIGQYSLTSISKAFSLFVYPTNYVFLVWLVVCYVAFYLVAYFDKKKDKFLEITFLSVMLLWIAVYVLFYNKTLYGVDNVSEPFILFLYFESMLLGALFKKHKEKLGKFNPLKIVFSVICVIVYFGSKLAFSKYDILLNFQIANQFVILLTLLVVFDLFMSLENFFKKAPNSVKTCVRHISNITLQIYIVQFVIIEHFESLAFPLNLAVVSILILLAASVLYYLEFFVRKLMASAGKNTRE